MRTLATSVLLAAACALSTEAGAQGYFAVAQGSANVTGASGTSAWASTLTDGDYVQNRSLDRSATVVNPGGSLNGKSTNASAAADLRTGKLGVLAAVSNQVSTNAQTSIALATGVAEFGDSYRLLGANGLPFAWTERSQISFNFHLDGIINVASTEAGNVQVMLALELFQPGAIGGYGPYAILGTVLWSGFDNGDSGFDLRANQYDTDPLQTSFIATTGGFSSGGFDLHAKFNPGGDFDWRVSLYVSAGMSTATGHATADLSHTATVTFAPPEGAIALASSGHLLGPVAAVPEPDTWALVALGAFAVLGAARRRRAG